MLGEIDPETNTFIPSEENLNTNEEIASHIDINAIPVNFKKVERIPINPDGFAPGSATEFADKVIIPGNNITMKDMQEPILANGEVLMPGEEAQFNTDYVVEEKLPKAQDGLRVDNTRTSMPIDSKLLEEAVQEAVAKEEFEKLSKEVQEKIILQQQINDPELRDKNKGELHKGLTTKEEISNFMSDLGTEFAYAPRTLFTLEAPTFEEKLRNRSVQKDDLGEVWENRLSSIADGATWFLGGELFGAGLGKAGELSIPYILGAEEAAKKLIGNTYKLNPWAFKPQEGMMYRGLGKEGFEDAIQSRVFRPKQQGYTEGRSISEIVSHPKQFRTTYYAPHRRFDVVQNYGPEYLAEVPFEGNLFRKRYGGKDWSWSTRKKIPIEEGRILQKDWLRGYKPVDIPKTSGSADELVDLWRVEPAEWNKIAHPTGPKDPKLLDFEDFYYPYESYGKWFEKDINRLLKNRSSAAPGLLTSPSDQLNLFRIQIPKSKLPKYNVKGTSSESWSKSPKSEYIIDFDRSTTPKITFSNTDEGWQSLSSKLPKSTSEAGSAMRTNTPKNIDELLSLPEEEILNLTGKKKWVWENFKGSSLPKERIEKELARALNKEESIVGLSTVPQNIVPRETRNLVKEGRKDAINWIESDEWLKRRMKATGESREQAEAMRKTMLEDLKNTTVDFKNIQGKKVSEEGFQYIDQEDKQRIALGFGDDIFNKKLRGNAEHEFIHAATSNPRAFQGIKMENIYPEIPSHVDPNTRRFLEYLNQNKEKHVRGVRTLQYLKRSGKWDGSSEITDDMVKHLKDNYFEWSSNGMGNDVSNLISNIKDKKTLKDFLNNVYTASGIIAGGAAGSAGIKD